jgi:hypothetical protein
VSDPVVAGPSLHGFILRHWQALVAGRTIVVRMIVLARTQSYAFRIRHTGDADGLTVFSAAPSNLLLRLAIAPLTVTFDSTTKNVVRYEGRVPPMRADGATLKPLDARVDYTMHLPAYR